MVPSIIPPSQWHSRDSNLWLWLWYHLFDRELCHFTSKPIDNEKDTLKSFMTFDITACMPVFGVIVESQIMIPNRNIYTYKQTINRINNRRKIIIHISLIIKLEENKGKIEVCNFLYHWQDTPLDCFYSLTSRGVHQTAPKLLAKWHNRITPQVTVHCMVQCSLWFSNKKTAQTALHCTLSIYY